MRTSQSAPYVSWRARQSRHRSEAISKVPSRRHARQPYHHQSSTREHYEAAAYAAAVHLISQGTPCAALCTSNLNQAIGALSALRRSGIYVPQDVSLIACDDDPLLQYLEVAVTSVRMPLLALGCAAVDALIAKMEGVEPRDMLVDLALELIAQESTRAFSAAK
jgi:LacI family transcriptional regulator, repressor for deo operon, udp, cdd, tsx, nupC, and nupG